MNIEDEIHESVCSIKFDYLDEKDVKDVAKLIQKARSPIRKPKALWYIVWADSRMYKARNKVGEFSFVKQNKSS